MTAITETDLSVKYRVNAHHSFSNVSRIRLIYRDGTTMVWNTTNASFFQIPAIQIRVWVCAIFYLGPVEYKNRNHLTNDDIEAYWVNEARHQLGTHVFVNRYGSLSSIVTNLHVDHSYTFTSHACICAIYPVIRMERPDPTQGLLYWLTLGLIYKWYSDVYDHARQLLNNPDYNRGGLRYNRHYYRLNSYQFPINAGRVHELKECDFAAKLANNRLIRCDTFCCAFYVCAGAKLVVYDQYNPVITEMSHNRSFVQQGGLVIVEGCQFQLAVQQQFQHYTLAEAQTAGLLNGDRDLSGIENPVIFLGPNDSEYQSIAWDLSIERNTADSPIRNCILTIPEGGWIAAIEDWDAGMAEVRARQLYERLHESTVDMFPTNPVVQPVDAFQVPEDLILRRILGMPGQDEQHRHYDCNIFAVEGISDNYNQTVPELPKQFNMYTCTQIDPGFHQNAKCAWVPPMYPPIQLYDSQNDFQYMPSIGTENVLPIRDSSQKVVESFLTEDGHEYPDFYYILDDQPVTIRDKQMKKMNVHFKAANSYGVNNRLGIDGWFYEYQKINNEYIPTITFDMSIYKSFFSERAMKRYFPD